MGLVRLEDAAFSLPRGAGPRRNLGLRVGKSGGDRKNEKPLPALLYGPLCE